MTVACRAAGSPSPCWGRPGEIAAKSRRSRLSGKPERYQALEEVYLCSAPAPVYEVESTWFHQAPSIFKFRGVDTISDAEVLAGAEVRVPLSRAHAARTGRILPGRSASAARWWTGAPASRWARSSGWEDAGGVGSAGGGWRLLIPFARAICVEIDPAARRIAVDLPEGLKELNRP